MPPIILGVGDVTGRESGSGSWNRNRNRNEPEKQDQDGCVFLYGSEPQFIRPTANGTETGGTSSGDRPVISELGSA